MKTFFDFMAQKMRFYQNKLYHVFFYNCGDKHHMLYFKNSNIMRCKSMRIFVFENWRQSRDMEETEQQFYSP